MEMTIVAVVLPFKSNQVSEYIGPITWKIGCATAEMTYKAPGGGSDIASGLSEHTCPNIKSAYEAFTERLRAVPAYRTHAERSSDGTPIKH